MFLCHNNNVVLEERANKIPSFIILEKKLHTIVSSGKDF